MTADATKTTTHPDGHVEGKPLPRTVPFAKMLCSICGHEMGVHEPRNGPCHHGRSTGQPCDCQAWGGVGESDRGAEPAFVPPATSQLRPRTSGSQPARGPHPSTVALEKEILARHGKEEESAVEKASRRLALACHDWLNARKASDEAETRALATAIRDYGEAKFGAVAETVEPLPMARLTFSRRKAAEELGDDAIRSERASAIKLREAAGDVDANEDADVVRTKIIDALIALGEARGLRNAAYDLTEGQIGRTRR